jgi:hypothetical protein
MFQIVKIDKELSKLIDAPKSLLELLQDQNELISNQYVTTKIVKLIIESGYSVSLSKASKKTEIRRYEMPKKLKAIFDTIYNQIDIYTEPEKELILSIKDNIDRQKGASRKQFALLIYLIKYPEMKFLSIKKEIKNSHYATYAEKKFIEKTKFNTLKQKRITCAIYRRIQKRSKIDSVQNNNIRP